MTISGFKVKRLYKILLISKIEKNVFMFLEMVPYSIHAGFEFVPNLLPQSP